MAGQLGDALKKALQMRGTPDAQKVTEPRPQSASVKKKPGKQNAKTPIPPPENTAPQRGTTSVPAATIRWTRALRENPAFARERRRRFNRLVPGRDGTSTDLLEGREPQNEADICLGIDFGTSAVKAVVRDVTRSQGYAVKFSQEQEDRYLLPTGVYKSNSGYSLDPGGVRLEDLKLSLLQPADQVRGDDLENACAFLGLVIRHCRGWFLSEYKPLYRHHLLNWRVNVGLPARSCEDTTLVERFQRVVWAAANIASDPGHARITQSGAATWLQRWSSTDMDDLGETAFRSQDVTVIPEIAAQTAGMVQARGWDVLHRPYFILVDVGAGTLDSAFFALLNRRDGGTRRFVFYSSDVRPLGVINLHRARTRWLHAALSSQQPRPTKAMDYLDRIDREAYGYTLIPDDVRSYLDGAEITPLQGSDTIDEQFFREGVLDQVCQCMADGKRRVGLHRDAVQALPLVISGGGSRMQFYSRLPGAVNHAWETRWQRAMSVQREQLVLPGDFEARGLAPADHDRMSVAYGLSLRNVWEIVRPDGIPPPPPPSRWQGGHLVSKDDV